LVLKISHERADMRRQLWVQAPLGVTIDGTAQQTVQWCLDGIELTGTRYAIGKSVALRINLPFQGFDIGFNADGVVQSNDKAADRTVVAFADLGARERDLLSHFVEQLVRGNMTTVDETIQRLDAPMAAAVLAAAPATSATAPSKRGRWPTRTAGMTAAYGFAGVAAFGYLASLLYSHLFWMETQTSAISAPVENLVSLGDGMISWGAFKPGEAVKAGDVVLKIADNTLEREIEQAEIAVREKENKLAFLARRFENERLRLGAIAGLSNLKNARSNAELEGMQAKLRAAERELRQLPSTAVGPLAQVRQRIVSLKQAIIVKDLEINGRATISRENPGSNEIVGQSVIGDVDNLAAQIELAEADIAIATRRHQSYMNQRDRLSLRAPFDGILRQLPHADSATLRKGDVAAVVERSAERGVTAFLRQDQVVRVQLGAQAIVHVPATRQTFRATVAEIDPARGSKADTHRSGGANGSASHGENGMAAVRLALTGPPSAIDLNVYRDGLPAVTMIGLSRVQQPSLGGGATKVGAAPVNAPLLKLAAQGDAAAPRASGWWLSDLFDRWIKSSRPSGARTN
jgi:multidrug resistance efflux pump